MFDNKRPTVLLSAGVSSEILAVLMGVKSR